MRVTSLSLFIPCYFVLVPSKCWRQTSLVVQWGRICLAMRRIQARSLVQNDSTRDETTNQCPQLLKRVGLERVLCSKRGRRGEKPVRRSRRAALARRSWRKPECCGEDPAQPKIIIIKKRYGWLCRGVVWSKDSRSRQKQSHTGCLVCARNPLTVRKIHKLSIHVLPSFSTIRAHPGP